MVSIELPVTCAFLLKGLQGEIKHLYRSFAFLSSKMVIENGGMIVCKAKQLVLAGGGKVRKTATAVKYMALYNRNTYVSIADYQ